MLDVYLVYTRRSCYFVCVEILCTWVYATVVVEAVTPLMLIACRISSMPPAPGALCGGDGMASRASRWYPPPSADAHYDADSAFPFQPRLKLSDYSGRSLSAFNSSSLVNDPDVPETAELRTWFAAAGGGSSFKSVSLKSGGGSDGERGGEIDMRRGKGREMQAVH